MIDHILKIKYNYCKKTVLTLKTRHNQSIETVFLHMAKKRREMRVNCLANKDKAQANMVEHTISTKISSE